MPLNLPGIPYKLTAEDVGQFDLINALSKGQQFGQQSMLFPGELQKQQLANQIAQIQAKYAEPTAQQSLLKSQQENIWNPKIWQSEISQRQAQTGAIPSEILLRQAQTKEAEALAGLHGTNAQQAALTQQYIRKILSQSQPGTVPTAQGGTSIGGIQPPSAQVQGSQNLQQTGTQPQGVQASPGIGGVSNYSQAAVLSHLLGLPASQMVDINGTQTAITPFGNFPVAQGLTAQQKALQSGLGAYAAKAYGENVESYKSLENQGSALDELTNAVQNDPEFKNVTGPIGSFLAKWSGTPQQKELLGRLSTASGEIALQVAPGLKGAFTGRDQTLINGIKANPSDMPDIFIGKLKAQSLINNVLKQRAQLSAQYLEQGLTPIEANKRAARETPLSIYRDQVNQLINPTIRNISNDELMKIAARGRR